MASDYASRYEYQQHLVWQARHQSIGQERARWSDREWRLVRELADVAWEISPVGLYVYKAQKACERVEWARFR